MIRAKPEPVRWVENSRVVLEANGGVVRRERRKENVKVMFISNLGI